MNAEWFVERLRKAAFTLGTAGNIEGEQTLLILAAEIELEVIRLDQERHNNLMTTGSTSG